MIKEKKIQDMTQKEYCSYVQYRYRNEPQWIRTRLISQWEEMYGGKKKESQKD